MTFDHLIYLLEVSKFKSISLAAKNLHVSQPTISIAINALEEELGAKLFYRSRAGTLPTDLGKVIIEKAKEIMNKMDEIKYAADNPNQLVGNLTISAVPGFCMSLLPKALVKYKKKFPHITIRISEIGTSEIEREMLSGQTDIGFVAYSTPTHFENHDKLAFKPILSTQIIAFVGQKSPLSHLESISLREIINHPLFIFNKGYVLHTRLLDLLSQYGEPNILLSSSTFDTGKQILTEGVGIGFATRLTIENDPYFETKRLVALPISDSEITHFYGYLRLRNKQLSTPSKEFINIITTP